MLLNSKCERILTYSACGRALAIAGELFRSAGQLLHLQHASEHCNAIADQQNLQQNSKIAEVRQGAGIGIMIYT